LHDIAFRVAKDLTLQRLKYIGVYSELGQSVCISIDTQIQGCYLNIGAINPGTKTLGVKTFQKAVT